jgi:hypothetical protein
MISNILAAAVGNAIKLFLAPPSSAVSWILLRNVSGNFVGPTDPSATSIFDGAGQSYILDTNSLVNGTPYFYTVFYFDGTTWTQGNVATATPAASYTDQSVDVLTVVRDRLDVGLQNEVVIKALSPASGLIEVLNAPPEFEKTCWPVVTVHVATDGSGERAVGEMIFPDDLDANTGMWNESQGWLARVQLTIVGWSKNPDERIALRRALRKIVIGNLDVFDSFGMVNIDFVQQDMDELAAYSVPVYQSMCTFSCEAPAGVTDAVSSLSSADPSVNLTTVF